MTDIELRKADALKGLDECPYIPCSISMTKERCDTIRELLQPSPDNEVDAPETITRTTEGEMSMKKPSKAFWRGFFNGILYWWRY